MSDYVITDQTGRIDKVLTSLEPEITRSQLKNLINDGGGKTKIQGTGWR